ncbi:hypothetical protein CPC08DRAFT_731590 [Agrocybe pediades]|nr:hypothetical protein CPC08DRAFT_731590 [Agrocybe pediades]
MSANTASKTQFCNGCRKSKPVDASEFQERRDGGFSQVCLECMPKIAIIYLVGQFVRMSRLEHSHKVSQPWDNYNKSLASTVNDGKHCVLAAVAGHVFRTIKLARLSSEFSQNASLGRDRQKPERLGCPRRTEPDAKWLYRTLKRSACERRKLKGAENYPSANISLYIFELFYIGELKT